MYFGHIPIFEGRWFGKQLPRLMQQFLDFFQGLRRHCAGSLLKAWMQWPGNSQQKRRERRSKRGSSVWRNPSLGCL